MRFQGAAFCNNKKQRETGCDVMDSIEKVSSLNLIRDDTKGKLLNHLIIYFAQSRRLVYGSQPATASSRSSRSDTQPSIRRGGGVKIQSR